MTFKYSRVSRTGKKGQGLGVSMYSCVPKVAPSIETREDKGAPFMRGLDFAS